jgi:hypothetical protein
MTATLFASALVIASLASGQSAKTWTLPHTADGQPDIQGVWSTATTTPLERPAEFAGKATLTPAEAAEYQKKAIYDVDGDRRDGGGAADVGRAYNEFWRERGKVVPDMRTSLITDPPDGKIPPLTPEARKRQADRAAAARGHEFDGPENRNLQERCLVANNAGPPMTPANYSANYQIAQGPGWVVLVNEMAHDARVIPLDGRAHIPQNVRQWMGDARGHWEGNTLVVETTNFTDKTPFRGSSDKMRLVERFTRTEANTLMYEFTVDDPATFGKPWTAKIPTTRVDGVMYEFACHEGNYGMTGVLSGARVAEGVKLTR